ncbi:hypothetical protein L1887_19954 [Cichorium endivia]|nr:hypothetical protein L1887_19954 [Cichorium endivia]
MRFLDHFAFIFFPAIDGREQEIDRERHETRGEEREIVAERIWFAISTVSERKNYPHIGGNLLRWPSMPLSLVIYGLPSTPLPIVLHFTLSPSLHPPSPLKCCVKTLAKASDHRLRALLFQVLLDQRYSVLLPEKLKSARSPLKLLSRFPDHPEIETLHDNFVHAVDTFPDYKYLGSRVRVDGTIGKYK